MKIFHLERGKVFQLDKGKLRNGRRTRIQKNVQHWESKLVVKNIENPNMTS